MSCGIIELSHNTALNCAPVSGVWGVGGIYFVSNREVGECYRVGILAGGEFPGFFQPDCGGDHWSGFLALRCECPPVGGQTLTHRLCIGGLGDRVCDGGYGGAAELAGLAELARLPLEGRGSPQTGVWPGRGPGMRDTSGVSGVRGVLVVTFGQGGAIASRPS